MARNASPRPEKVEASTRVRIPDGTRGNVVRRGPDRRLCVSSCLKAQAYTTRATARVAALRRADLRLAAPCEVTLPALADSSRCARLCQFVPYGGLREDTLSIPAYVGVSGSVGIMAAPMRCSLAIEGVPAAAVNLFRLSPQGVDAVPPKVLRPMSSRPASLPRHPASGLVACAVAVLLVSCSGTGVDPSKFDWSTSDLGVRLIVHIQNSTAADFWGSVGPVQVGSDEIYLSLWSKVPPSSLPYFDVRRGADQSTAVKLARITFRALKYPEGNSSNGQDVTITVTEPSAGVFSATTPDTSWIEIVSVTQLQ